VGGAGGLLRTLLIEERTNQGLLWMLVGLTQEGEETFAREWADAILAKARAAAERATG
jgi:hypothetical protein